MKFYRLSIDVRDTNLVTIIQVLNKEGTNLKIEEITPHKTNGIFKHKKKFAAKGEETAEDIALRIVRGNGGSPGVRALIQQEFMKVDYAPSGAGPALSRLEGKGLIERRGTDTYVAV